MKLGQLSVIFGAGLLLSAFQEDIKGMVKVGYLADFIVFDKDIMTIPDNVIPGVENHITIVGVKNCF
jgi:predicted amidohydrolase YtcJ